MRTIKRVSKKMILRKYKKNKNDKFLVYPCKSLINPYDLSPQHFLQIPIHSDVSPYFHCARRTKDYCSLGKGYKGHLINCRCNEINQHSVMISAQISMY